MQNVGAKRVAVRSSALLDVFMSTESICAWERLPPRVTEIKVDCLCHVSPNIARLSAQGVTKPPVAKMLH
jgi:hypothetical protein